MELHKKLEAEINNRNPSKRKTAILHKVYLLYCCNYNSTNHIGVFTTYSKANSVKTKLLTELNITSNIEEFILDNSNFNNL